MLTTYPFPELKWEKEDSKIKECNEITYYKDTCYLELAEFSTLEGQVRQTADAACHHYE